MLLTFLFVPCNTNLKIVERSVRVDSSVICCDAAYFVPQLLKDGPSSFHSVEPNIIVSFPTFNECLKQDVPLFFYKRSDNSGDQVNIRSKIILDSFANQLPKLSYSLSGDVLIFWRRSINETKHNMKLANFGLSDLSHILGISVYSSLLSLSTNINDSTIANSQKLCSSPKQNSEPSPRQRDKSLHVPEVTSKNSIKDTNQGSVGEYEMISGSMTEDKKNIYNNKSYDSKMDYRSYPISVTNNSTDLNDTYTYHNHVSDESPNMFRQSETSQITNDICFLYNNTLQTSTHLSSNSESIPTNGHEAPLLQYDHDLTCQRNSLNQKTDSNYESTALDSLPIVLSSLDITNNSVNDCDGLTASSNTENSGFDLKNILLQSQSNGRRYLGDIIKLKNELNKLSGLNTQLKMENELYRNEISVLQTRLKLCLDEITKLTQELLLFKDDVSADPVKTMNSKKTDIKNRTIQDSILSTNTNSIANSVSLKIPTHHTYVKSKCADVTQSRMNPNPHPNSNANASFNQNQNLGLNPSNTDLSQLKPFKLAAHKTLNTQNKKTTSNENEKELSKNNIISKWIVAEIYKSSDDSLNDQFAQLTKGDIVTIEREDSSGWWWVTNGTANGSGWYPYSYLQPLNSG